jgi:atypical dual specificity phosphatase
MELWILALIQSGVSPPHSKKRSCPKMDLTPDQEPRKGGNGSGSACTITNRTLASDQAHDFTMLQPHGFYWVDKPHLAGLAQPESEEDLDWLRQNGIEVLICLTEDPPRRDWINNAGLFALHVPVMDMDAPAQEQLDTCLSAIARAHEKNMGVCVHCGAGLGRTGVVLACFFVSHDLTAQNAIARVRRLRPGSVETEEQEQAVEEFARRKNRV